MARQIKIRERVDCPAGKVLKWETTISDHGGMATECFDKHLNEIYERDVVRMVMPGQPNSAAEMGAVYFADGCFWVHFMDVHLAEMPLHTLTDSDGLDVEIVGNLDDNPELVEDWWEIE